MRAGRLTVIGNAPKCPHRGFTLPNGTAEVPGTLCPFPEVQRAQKLPGVRREQRKNTPGMWEGLSSRMRGTLNWEQDHSTDNPRLVKFL